MSHYADEHYKKEAEKFAKEKEKEREALIKNNPALQNAYNAIKRAEENFDIISKFVENDEVDETWVARAAP